VTASQFGLPVLPDGPLGPVSVAVPLNEKQTGLPWPPQVGYGERHSPGRHDSPRQRPDDCRDARPSCDLCPADVQAHATNWTDADGRDPRNEIVVPPVKIAIQPQPNRPADAKVIKGEP